MPQIHPNLAQTCGQSWQSRKKSQVVELRENQNSHTTKTTEQMLVGRKLTKGMGEEVKKEKEESPWK